MASFVYRIRPILNSYPFISKSIKTLHKRCRNRLVVFHLMRLEILYNMVYLVLMLNVAFYPTRRFSQVLQNILANLIFLPVFHFHSASKYALGETKLVCTSGAFARASQGGEAFDKNRSETEPSCWVAACQH